MNSCKSIYLEHKLNSLFDEAFAAFTNYQEGKYENHDEAYDAYLGSLNLYAKVAEVSLETALSEMQELYDYVQDLHK